jgi:hypothetical protein
MTTSFALFLLVAFCGALVLLAVFAVALVRGGKG